MAARLQDGDGAAHENGTPATLSHQALRREVNEQIRRINQSLHTPALGSIDVMCECVHPDCLGLIAIKLSEYEAARSTPGQYLVKAGHEVSDDERIVAHADGHVIVKKLREKVGPTVSQPSTNGHDSEAARVSL
jgi:hypothetical protein